jgi:hypothetical protein
MNLFLPALSLMMSTLGYLGDPLRHCQRLVSGALLMPALRGILSHFCLMLVELKLVDVGAANPESLDVPRLILSHGHSSPFWYDDAVNASNGIDSTPDSAA